MYYELNYYNNSTILEDLNVKMNGKNIKVTHSDKHLGGLNVGSG